MARAMTPFNYYAHVSVCKYPCANLADYFLVRHDGAVDHPEKEYPNEYHGRLAALMLGLHI
jgi:hypothetical protein